MSNGWNLIFIFRQQTFNTLFRVLPDISFYIELCSNKKSIFNRFEFLNSINLLFVCLYLISIILAFGTPRAVIRLMEALFPTRSTVNLMHSKASYDMS